jgi:glutamate synthase domain-containing protein 3
MTGGQAFVYDPAGLMSSRLNAQLVEAVRLDDAQSAELRYLVEKHRQLTDSIRADELLFDWPATLANVWRVAPVDEVARIERANEGLLGASR